MWNSAPTWLTGGTKAHLPQPDPIDQFSLNKANYKTIAVEEIDDGASPQDSKTNSPRSVLSLTNPHISYF